MYLISYNNINKQKKRKEKKNWNFYFLGSSTPIGEIWKNSKCLAAVNSR